MPLVALLLCLVQVTVGAQSQPTLRGVVRDGVGAVVVDARVTVTPQPDGAPAETRTDERGAFAMPLPPGRYTVRVSMPGFTDFVGAVPPFTNADPPALEVTLAAAGFAESITVLATPSRLATKAETPIMQTPQSITVVTEEVLDQQGVTTLGEALRNVSGAALSGNWRGTYEVFAQRGFYSDSDGNFRRNGIEVSKFASVLSPNAERVEVLKGPASVLYGRLDPGGVINVVTKRPQAARASEIELRGGSFGHVEGRYDTTGAVPGTAKALFRFNAAVEGKGSYRDVVNSRSVFVSPVLSVLFDANTKWDIDVEHKRDRNTVDVGIAAPVNSFAALDAMPINTFLGEVDGRATLSYTSGVSTFERVLGRSWTLRNVISYIDYDRSPHDVTLGALAADRRTIARSADFREQKFFSGSADVTLLGSFQTGGLQHRLAIGGTAHRTALDQQQNRAAIAPVNIFNPVLTGLPSSLPLVADSRQEVDNGGMFIQDQISIPGGLHLQGAVRVSRFEQETVNRITGTTQVVEVNNVSPQVGAAYLPRPWLSLYGSYSESFAPNLAIAADGSTFGPKTAEQYETGVKADAWGGRLTATLAIFRLTYNGNLSFIRNPETGLFDTVQGGVQRSTGTEIDISVRPSPRLSVLASYGGLNGRVVTDPVYQPGRPLGGAPDHRANVWVAWESAGGIGIGGGVFHQSSFKEFTSSDAFLPAFTTVDATASYRLSPRTIVRVNGKNLLNERYYLSGAGSFVAYPAPPRHVVASLQLRF